MVYHILKDGSTLSDITGKVVKPSEAPQLYDLIGKLSKRSQNEKQNT